MPFEAGFDEIVSILTTFYRGEYDFLRQTYGDQAPSLADEMGEMIGALLQNETPYGQLWLEYVKNPQPNEAELIGALEMLEEPMPEFSIRIEGYYAAFADMAKEQGDLIETSEPDDLVNIEELDQVKSTDDFDDDDEYREDFTYLRGNVEDRSTSPLYYEGLDTSIEPNQTEED